MIRLIQYLIFGHMHHWEVVSVKNMMDEDEFYYKQVVVLRCSKCGNIKQKNIIL